MCYEGLRARFTKIIDHNLEGDDFLDVSSFTPIRNDMKGKGLKFYRYRSPSSRFFDQLRDDTLPFSNPKTFNDIFEGMVKSKDNNNIDVNGIIKQACNAVSIACFSETWSNQLMYAHYTSANNKFCAGFCIEYDYDRMLEYTDLIRYFFPVIYQHAPSNLAKMEEVRQAIENYKPSIVSNSSPDGVVDDLISYFIHKPYFWNYEEEWRLIVPISMFDYFFAPGGSNPSFHEIRNFDCVSAVYLAANINMTDRRHIMDIVRGKNSTRKNGELIKVYNTNIIEGSYEIECEEIQQ